MSESSIKITNKYIIRVLILSILVVGFQLFNSKFLIQSYQTAEAAGGGMTVFFKKPGHWDSARIFWWSPTGVACNDPCNVWNNSPTMTNLGNNWWAYTINGATSANIIFRSNGGGYQSGNLSRSSDGWYNGWAGTLDNNQWSNSNAYPDGDTTAPTFNGTIWATSVTSTQAILNWQTATDGASGLKEYQIYGGTDGNSLLTTLSSFTMSGAGGYTLKSGNQSYTVTGLSSGTTYKFSVRAVDWNGNYSSSALDVTPGAYSKTITVDGTATDWTGSATPANNEIFGTSTASTDIRLTWDANDVFVGYNGSDFGASASTTKWASFYIGIPGVSGTTTGIAYGTQNAPTLPFEAKYQIQARSDGNGSNFFMRTWSGTAWSANVALTSTNIAKNGMLEFKVPRITIGNPTTIRVVALAQETFGGVEKAFYAMPFNWIGADGYNPTYNKSFYQFNMASTFAAAGQVYPYNMTLSSKTSKSVTLALNNMAATSVQIQQSTDGGSTWTNPTGGNISGTATFATITGLTPNTPYLYRMVVTGGTYAGTAATILGVSTNANSAPTDISLSASSIAENNAANAVVGNLSTTDVDTLDTFTYSLVAGAGDTDNGTFNINSNQLRVTNANALNFETKSSYSVRVQTSDGSLTFAKSMTITVTNVNEAPTISAVSTLTSATEDTAYSITYAALAAAADEADVDASSTLVFRIEAVSSGTLTKGGTPITAGTTTLGSGETIVWTPASNANGTLAAFTIKVSDGSLVSTSTVQVNVAVTAVNDVPTLTTITALTGASEDTAYSITYASLAAAANEADVDGDAISFRVEAVSTGTLTKNGTPVTAGTTTLGAGETLVWTPAGNANGTLNAFTVKAYDGTAASATAIQVQVTVAAVNDAPTISDVANQSTNEDTATGSIAITINDTETALGSLTMSGTSSNTTLVPNASIVFSGTTGSRTVVITPAANQNGTTTITLTVSDGTTSTSDTFVLTVTAVNDTPTLSTISTLTGASEDTAYTITYADLAAAANEADVDGDVLSFRVEAVSTGTLTKNGTPVTAGTTTLGTGESLVWTAAANASGTLNAFTVKAYDGTAASATAVQVQVTVTAVNDAPTISDVTNKTTNEDTATTAIAITVGDTESGANPLTMSGSSSNTTLVPNGNIVFGGTGANRTVTITPAANQNGSVTITVTVSDGTLSTSDTFVLTVTAVNDTPTLTTISDLTGATEDTAYTITYASLAAAANEADVDGDTLSFLVAAVSTGTLTKNGTPVTANTTQLGTGESLVWTPAANANGTINAFTVKAHDGTVASATAIQVKVVVSAVNDAPTNISLSASTLAENNAIGATIGTLSATDGDSSVFTYSLVAGTGDTNNAHFQISGSTLQAADVLDFETDGGSESIRIQVSDGSLTYQEAFTITVTNVNEAATSITLTPNNINEKLPKDSTVGTLTNNDPDAGNTFTYTKVGGTGDTDNAAFTITGSTLTSNNTLNYEVKNQFSMRIKVSDGTLTFEQQITIYVNDTNDAPTGITLSSNPIDENNGAGNPVATMTAVDPDVEDTSFTFNLQVGNGTNDVDNAKFTIVGNELRTVANVDYETQSIYYIRVRVTDPGNLTKDVSLTITVNDLNEAPTNISLTASTIAENAAVNTGIGTLSATDVDAGSTFTYSLVAGTGDTDNASFNISTASLRSSEAFNFEVKSSYSIRVRVTDNGGLTFEKVFTITVTNVNEASSTITLTPSTVAENNAANAVVGTLGNNDPDLNAQTFTYSLVAGTGDTNNATFNINGTNLRVTTANVLNLEVKSSYSVRVRVSDGGLNFDQALTITVTNVNETPTALTLSATSIAENNAADATVGTFTTTDVDAGDTFTYTLVAGTGSTDNASFNINGSALRSTNSLNFEAKSSYAIRVRTTDAGGLWFEQQFTITVTNVNEAPTDIALSATSIAENAAVNTTVGTLSATDADAASTFTYTLVAGAGDTDNASFNISTTSLRSSASFNFEAKSSYSIRVRVTDNTSLTYEESFTITVTNVNEAPTDIALSNDSIAENGGANATVGTLSATDPDASPTFTFTLVAGTGDTGNASFNISGTTLRATASLDFEAQSSYSVRVQVSDGALTYAEAFIITVSNANEAPTDIALSTSTIAENAAINTSVGTLSATDSDAGSTFTFTLVAGTGDTDNARFNINGTSLRSSEVFDFESTTSYSIRVQVSDGSLTYAEAFTITVSNVNEAPIDINVTSTSIAENAAVNTTVGILSAVDVDAGSTFTYSLVAGTGDTNNASFNINGSSLRSSAAFDFETKSSYSVRIQVSDGSLTYAEAFTITVTNVNEAPTDIALSNSSLAENAGSNATVGTLSATDPDAGSSFTFTLVAGTGATDNASFNISGSTLRATSSLDYETKSSYSVRVQVSDGSLTYAEAFSITVTDVVENFPPTDITLSSTSIAENGGANAVVGTLTATDPDVGDTFTFTLVAGTGDTDNASFNISGNSLRATSSLDFEVKSSYSVRIRVSDGGQTFEKSFTITVTNVNEAPTDIALSASTIAENAGANAVVGTLSATDPDASSTFTFTLVAGTGDTNNAAFNISGTSLRATSSIDFETNPTMSVRVQVSDGSLTYAEAFSITVTNVNEAPTDIALSSTSIAENSGANAVVGTLSATDPDAGSTFTFTLVAGAGDTDNASFNISSTSLRATSSLDYDTKSSYSLRVQVSDGSLTYSEAFTITVTNVNEAPTDIALSASTIAENAGANAVVGTLSATDPDAGSTFTFTLVAGTGDTNNVVFNINGTSLRATSSLDFETNPTMSVRVQVSDGSLTYAEAFTITVTNVNEAPTDIALSSTSIAENSGANAVVGTLSATDPDAGSSFTFTLVAGTGDADNATFNISSTSLRATSSLDYDTKSSYSVRVQVTDGSLTYAEAFTITVTNQNEAPTDIALSASTIAENAGANAVVGTLSATDPDAGSTFTFTLVAGTGDTNNAAFNISGTSLRATSSIDFETNPTMSVRVQVSDGSLTYAEAFTITVTNVNEAPTDIALSTSTIAENAGANAVVGTLSGTDQDAGTSFTFTLVAGTGDTNNAAFNISGTSLRATSSIDFETNPSMSVRVQVSDGSLTYTEAFTITITNVNEAPTDIALSNDTVSENAGANATVGTLSATDPDASSTFTFTLVAGAGDTGNASFNINGTTLRATSSLNYATQNSYSVRVQVSDGILTYAEAFTITVQNQNDAPTDIALSNSSIAENAGANATVGTLSATDPDPGATFTFTLVAGTGDTNNAAFNISGTTLRATSSIDFETNPTMSVRVQVSDGSLTFAEAFTITVTNVNEVPTDIALTSTSIAENSGANAIIGTLSATDPDAGSTFTFTLVAGTGDTDNAEFSISGAVFRAVNNFNFESKSSYSVRVQVSDGSLTYAEAFAISVTNVNEAPTDVALSASTIAENAGVNAVVGTLSATDPDAGSTFTFTLVAGTGDTNNAAFNISGTSLRATSSIDFETNPTMSVRVQVSDGALTFSKSFAITVTNVNEAPTDIALSTSTIAENAGANASVGTLSATDSDAGSTFTFTLVAGTGDTNNAAFNISGTTLRATSSIDFETNPTMSVRVQVSDGSLTYAEAFTITVTNVNEAPTDIALSSTSIAENAGANATVGTLSATDPDAGSSFTYTLVAGSGDTDNATFNINGTALRATSSLDYDTKSSYSVRVQVSDGSLTFSKSFAITVTNVNEAPTDIALSASTIAENAGANATVGTLSATDPDAGTTFTFTLVAGTGDTNNAAFNINGTTLRATSSIDFETNPTMSVRVQVSDGSLTYAEAFTITVTNVNEAPTDIALSSSTIAENAGANATVGTLSATDPDAGSTFTFTLVAGTGDTNNAAFNISGTTLRASSSIDFETNPTMSVRVQVSDGTLTFSKSFTITVTNVNETPTDIALSNSSIEENSPANATVGTLSATDPDAGSTFTYTLVAGSGDTDNASFNISGTTLRATSSFDYDIKSSYSIRVQVSDGSLTYSKSFGITVTNANEAPTDIALSSSSVAENAGANATVGTLTATDPDVGSTFTFTLVAGTGDTNNAAFNISGTTLRATSSIDFETNPTMSVRIQVSDGILTYSEAFTITVTNVNETPTDISLSSSSIAENAGANASVGTLSATDPDAGSTFTFTLVAGTGDTNNAAFNISGTTLRATSSIDFESNPTMSVRVQVTDGSLTFSKSFTITVTNVNETPTDISLSSTTIAENAGANAVVGTLSATDPDAGSTFTFTLVAGTGDTDNGAFNISGTSLRATSSIDFETNPSMSVRVQVSDGSLTFSKAFNITITNVNEAPTDIILSSASIAENAGVNAVVGTLSATDPDASTTFTFNLIAGTGSTDNASFNISGTALRATSSLNYESKSSMSVLIQVSDGSLTYSEVFTITVTNVNETPTDIALTSTTIAENAGANATVGTLSATDPDASSTFTFTLIAGTGDTNNADFNISGTTLRATNSFNFETKSSYSILVQVSDGSLTYSEAFTITVTNVNEAPTDIALSNVTIAENAGANATVGTLSATDPDASTTFTFSLVAGTGDTDNAAFNISGTALRATSSLDFESKSSMSVRVQVTDGSLTYDEAFTITVTNVNEAPTDIALSNATIAENAGANATVGTLSATDPDAGATFSFSLVAGTGDTDNAAFNISGTTLRATSSLNFENKSSMSVRVQVSDGSLTYAEAIAITVTNVNETPTDIALSNSSVEENSGANATVGTLSATDPDAGSTFTFTLVAGSGDTDNAAFNINGTTLRATSSFDFDVKSSYSIRVEVSDGSLTYAEVFPITVTNQNEAPTDIALSNSSIAENAGLNATVGTLSATDPDAGTTFSYSLVAGTGDTDNASFNISGITLRATNSLDFEVKSSMSVRVQVSDGSLTYSEAFSITVTNVNEAPTDISLSNSSIDENSGANATVGTLSATDPDAGSTFTFSLVSGSGDTDNGTFNISGTTLRATISLNFEAKSNYSIRVQVSDGSLSYAKVFPITVTNVNEAPTDIALSNTVIAEKSGANATIGTLTATDPDAGATFTFTLVAGSGDTDNASFNISSTSLRATSDLDFETKSLYSVRVQVSDGSLTYSEPFTISVTNINEAPTDIALSSSTIAENSGANATVGTLSATDEDAGSTFTFTLVGGTGSTDNASFNIAGTVLKATSNLNFEAKSSYSVRIQVSDGALTYSEAFAITVSDVNEAPTDISLSSSSIEEDSGANATVGTLSATDPDAGSTFTFTLTAGSGDTDNAAFNISGTSLRATSSFDYETKTSYSVRVQVSDGSLTFSKSFAITVTNKNDAPTNITLTPTSIPEASGANATVGTLTATDPDTGDTFTFTLVSGTGDTDNAEFNISGALLRATNNLDYETKSSYSVRVQVSDGALTFQKSFAITVTDVNEPPSDIDLTSTSIAENSGANATVGTLSAADHDAGASFTFTLVPGSGDTNNASFNIAGTTLRANASFNYEVKNSYSIRVQVSDGSLSYSEAFTITVTNVNEAPTDIMLSNSTIAENSGADATVGSLSATDVDAGTTFTYTLVAGTGDSNNTDFNIDGASLRADASFDFETKSSYTVRIEVSDGSLTYSEAFTITVTNQNEAPTDLNLSNATIAENAGVNATVGSLSASDPDAGSTFSYTLVAGSGDTNNGLFNISGTALRAKNSLDFETQPSLSVRVQVSDGSLTYAEEFAITVTDVNEPPTDIALSSSSINENAGTDAVVGTLSATDQDAGSTFSFSLIGGTGSTNNASFNINDDELRANSSFNFESKSSYSVRIQVSDGSLTYSEAFTITVLNVNEVPTDISLSTSSISENNAVNATIGNLTAVDPDAGSVFTYTLVAGDGDADNGSFNILGFALRASESFDFETKTTYSIRIQVSDGGLTYEESFTITILNANEPPTDIELTATSIAENSGVNAVVGTLSAVDADGGTGFSYSLVGGTGSTNNASFNISGTSLRASFNLNFEAKSDYSVRIQVSDGSLTYAEAFEITVTDVNEAPTDISLSSTNIEENAGANAAVGTLSAVDPDADSTFTFSLVSGAGSADNANFQISDTTLQAKQSLDSEAQAQHFIRIRVSDGSLSYDEEFIITVNNLNEAPTLTSVNTLTGANEDSAFVITYNAMIAAADEYDSDGNTLSFRIQSLTSGTLTKNGVAVSAGSTLLSTGQTLVWTPASNANGTIPAFMVKVFDGTFHSADDVQVSVDVNPVNDAPTMTTVTTLTGATEDTAYNISYSDLATAANEADIDGDEISFLIVSVLNGTLKINGNPVVAGSSILGADDALEWTGAADASGLLNAFSIRAHDGTVTSSSAITVKIDTEAVNDPPTMTMISNLSGAYENQAYNITYSSIANAANEADPENASITFLIESISAGTLTLNDEEVNAGETTIAPGDTLVWIPALNTEGLLNAFKIKAYDGELYSSPEIQVKVTVIPDTIAPSTPRDFQVTDLTATSFTISWTQSVEESIPAVVYEVYSNGVLVGSTTDISYDFSGLTEYTQYAITVRAKDAAGNASPQSVPYNVRTLDVTDPTTPTNLNATNVVGNGLRLNWTASTDAGSGIKHYSVFMNDVLLGTTSNLYYDVTGLDEYTEYTFKVKATDNSLNESADSSDLTVRTKDVTPPTVPANVSSSDITSTSMTISWDASTDEHSGMKEYEVFVNAVLFGKTADTTISITGLSNYTAYDITVKAVDMEDNKSAASTVLNERTADELPPTVPANFRTTDITATSITLAWNSSTDEGVGMKEYEVFKNDVSIGTTEELTMEVTGLTPETSYTFKVVSRDLADNTSTPATLTAATIKDLIPPTQPTDLEVTDVGYNVVSLSWTESEDNVAVTGYQMYVNGVLKTTAPGNVSTFELTGLLPKTNYTLFIRAIDAANNKSLTSNSVTFTTSEDIDAPTSPTNVQISNVLLAGFTVSWTAATDAIGVKEYEIYAAHLGVDKLIGTSTTTTFIATKIPPGKTYQVTVVAVDAQGNKSDPSANAEVTLAVDTTKPTEPTNLSTQIATATSLTIRWVAATDDAFVDLYKIYKNNVLVGTSTTTNFLVSNLQPETSYTFTVVACDSSSNESLYSTAHIGTTIQDRVAPAIPTGLVSSEIIGTGFKVSWTATTDNVGVTGYIVFVNGVQMGTTVGTEYTVTGRKHDTSYNVTVLAFDVRGNKSKQSVPLAVKTLPDTTLPTSPTGLAATFVKAGSLTLLWSQATDNVGVTEYEVYKDGVSLGKTKLLGYQVTGLAAGVKYEFTVKAHDAAQNESAASLAVEATTSSDTIAPHQPMNLGAINVTATSLTVTWSEPKDNVGIVQYKLFNESDTELATISTTSYEVTGLSAETVYGYKVKAIDNAGNVSEYSSLLKVRTRSADYVHSSDVMVYTDHLSAVAFKKSTINYTLPKSAKMTVKVMNSNYVPVMTILNSTITAKGNKRVAIPISRSMAAGNYYVEVTAMNPATEEKLTIIRALTVDKVLPEISTVTDVGNITDAQSAATGNYTLSEASFVSIDIFDTKKKLVKRLHLKDLQSSGNKTFSWDGTDNRFAPVPDGVYTVKVNATDFAGSKAKMQTSTVSIERNNPSITNIVDAPDVFRLTGKSINTIKFTLSEKSRVTVQIFDGETLINTLINNKVLDFGPQVAIWNGKRSSDGQLVPDKVYTYKITATDLAENDPAVETGTIRTDKTQPLILNLTSDNNNYFATTGLNTTTITFELSEDASLFAEIYNSSNKLVRVVYKSELRTAGSHTFIWNGRNDASGLVADGMYTLRIYATDEAKIKGAPSNLSILVERVN